MRQISDILPVSSQEQLEDVYVATELMESDLSQVIAGGHVLEAEQLLYIVYQVLRGLVYIHSANVIHRDVKPGNILISSECDVKICDFGLARVAKQKSTDSIEALHNREMTEYVATRWYRAPEIMLSWTEYTSAVDIWSVGCVLAELVTLKPLFAGKDYLHQLQLIASIRGTPHNLEGISSPHALEYMKGLPSYDKVELQTLFPDSEQNLLQALDKMLAFAPQDRITAQELLAQPYFASLHDPTDEPVAKCLFSWNFEEVEMSCDELKQLFWDELVEMHPSIALECQDLRDLAPPSPDDCEARLV